MKSLLHYLQYDKNTLNIHKKRKFLVKQMKMIRSLSKSDLELLKQWKGFYVYVLNSLLRSDSIPPSFLSKIQSITHKKFSPKSIPFYQSYFQKIIQRIDHFFHIPSPSMTLFRGVTIPLSSSFDIKQWKKDLRYFKSGKRVQWSGYSSTTFIPSIARDYTIGRSYSKKSIHILYVLHLHKKHRIPILFYPDIFQITRSPSNWNQWNKRPCTLSPIGNLCEIILPRSITWKCKSIRKIKNFEPYLRKNVKNRSIYVVELESCEVYQRPPLFTFS